MIDRKFFIKLGFSDKEAAVYLALLQLDTVTATDISKKTGINRTSAYDILDSLMQKGLIGKFKKDKKSHFSAGDPKRLINYFEHEKEESIKTIGRKQREVESVLPEIAT